MVDRWGPGNSAFWEEQSAHRFDEHVRPFNELVGRLIDERGTPVPSVAPWNGGIDAPVFYLLTEPDGDTTGGAGWVCARNKDASSRRQRELMLENRIEPEDLSPWNAYPWARHARAGKGFTEDERRAGSRVMLQALSLMRDPRVLFIQGAHASKVAESVKVQLRVKFPNMRIILAPGVTVRTGADIREQERRWAELGAIVNHLRRA